MFDAKGLEFIQSALVWQFDESQYLTSMASGLGPTQTRPAFPTFLAKSAFSDKKP